MGEREREMEWERLWNNDKWVWWEWGKDNQIMVKRWLSCSQWHHSPLRRDGHCEISTHTHTHDHHLIHWMHTHTPGRCRCTPAATMCVPGQVCGHPSPIRGQFVGHSRMAHRWLIDGEVTTTTIIITTEATTLAMLSLASAVSNCLCGNQHDLDWQEQQLWRIIKLREEAGRQGKQCNSDTIECN